MKTMADPIMHHYSPGYESAYTGPAYAFSGYDDGNNYYTYH